MLSFTLLFVSVGSDALMLSTESPLQLWLMMCAALALLITPFLAIQLHDESIHVMASAK